MSIAAKETPATHPELLLEMMKIHKRFPGVHALKGVHLDVWPGETHALVGENGAGKSTLMHILAGVHQPDSGRISFNGHRQVNLENERLAQQLGIGMVFQERSLVDSLSVAENVFFSRQPASRLGIIDYRALFAQTQDLLEQLGLDISPRTLVGRLSPAQQQMVEIAKALSLNAKLLILDEPTSAIVQSTPGLVGIAGFDSESGPGIGLALKESGKAGEIVATCVDAEEQHLTLVKEGVLVAAVGQKRELFTYQGVKALYSFNHSQLQFTADDAKAGVAPIPEIYYTGTYTVTPETVDLFLA